ncbi:polyphosphate kinase 1 [candidate division KSB1 bacterium]
MMKSKPVQYINREISWLYFNERVLQEALDITTPLVERIKFLGIFSNNRDEFFRVRVGTLNRMLHFKKDHYHKEENPENILKEINKIVAIQEEEFTNAYIRIVKELSKNNIFIIDEKQLNTKQGIFVKNYFKQNVRSQLFPMMVNDVQDWTSLKDNSIYLVVSLFSKSKDIKETHALIEVPANQISRFLVLPEMDGKKHLILLDDVIRYCLADIFSIYGYSSYNAYTIKFTRDAELDIDNDISKSFLEIIGESVKMRKKGMTVRFVYDNSIPSKILKKIMKKLKITENDKIRGGGKYHNFKDFMSFPKIGSENLVYPDIQPLEHKELPPNKSIIDIIRKKDILMQYPYQSFHHFIDLLREASIDPSVRAIKITLYRVARNSNVMNALINAARNGKEVIVFLELQARFDEQSNIHWSEKLQEEGIRIIKTIPGIKVHCKMLLIRRKESGNNIYYANLSTGNYNESTAKIYGDTSLLTNNPDITTEVNRIFHLLEESYNPPIFKHLIVAPFRMRQSFMRLLNREIRHAKEGKEAWIIIKLNNLVDNIIVNKLYQASQAGVKITLIIRGICVLVPGIRGLSDNIEAFSIVDKFLEHSRVLVFANAGNPAYYITSADWMPRNFDHRIELACPIYDKKIQKELMKMLEIQIADNVKARLISAENPNQYKKTSSKKDIRSQIEFYDYLKGKG